MANVTTVASPLQLFSGKFNSPLDAREKLVIAGNEPTEADFDSVKEPYIHMRIHVCKEETVVDGTVTVQSLGVYEVDSLKEVSVFGVKNYKIKDYHKVYSSTSGRYENYHPDAEHKDVIYFCTDDSGDYVGKIYFNSLPYGGGQGGSDGNFTVDTDNNLLIVEANKLTYCCPVEELSKPAVPEIESTGDDTSKTRILTFKSNNDNDRFKYRIKNHNVADWSGINYIDGNSVVITASDDNPTTQYDIQVRAYRYRENNISDSLNRTYTTARHLPNVVVSANGDKFDTSRTITIEIDGRAITGAKIYYTIDGVKTEYDPSNKPVITSNTPVSKNVTATYEKDGWVKGTSNSLPVDVATRYIHYGVVANVSAVPTTDAGVLTLPLPGNGTKKTSLPLSEIKVSGVANNCFVVAVPNTLTVKSIQYGVNIYEFTSRNTENYKVYYVVSTGDIDSTTEWTIK